MRALYLLLPILGILAIAYRYYSAFIAARIWCWTTARTTPAHIRNDGHNYHPTHRVGAVRPPLRRDHRRRPAGRPGAGGAVRLRARLHLAGRRRAASPARCTTSIVLWASTRRGGKSLADIVTQRDRPVRRHSSPPIAILFIIVIALAGLGIAVVNALADSAWGTFTIGHDDPARACSWASGCIVWRKGTITRGDDHRRHRPAAGRRVSASRSAAPTRGSRACSTCRARRSSSRSASTASSRRCCRCGCCCAPRDYLSSFMKIGTIVLLVDRRDHRQSRAARCRRSPSSPAAAGRSFRARCSRSASSPSRAARSPASTR